MDGLRPTLLFLLGERGNAASILEWQHQTDRKTRRLRRRECSPVGASGFGSSHSSTFALADRGDYTKVTYLHAKGERMPNITRRARNRRREGVAGHPDRGGVGREEWRERECRNR